jgi:argininosuccinate lyase
MKLWDGRLAAAGTDGLMESFNNSLAFDRALIEEDIAGSSAWARALSRAGVLKPAEAERIVAGLSQMRDEYGRGALEFLPSDEDIHTAVERILIERIGDTGAKLHTGRSRNDQVVTDLRLFTIKRLAALGGRVRSLQAALVKRAEADAGVIIPGYTHLQQAQVVLLPHYWLSFVFALEREKQRIAHASSAADLMPLGSGALAGSGFAVDRQQLAKDLGFSAVSDNSMDGVAARDFVLEALSAIASLGLLLSRYAEDLIIWSSREFGYVELSDAWSTGSSMMPQKKNPDSLELIRGKGGRFVGNYMRFAATLKGVGLTYYKDLQEDKESLFDSLAQADQVLAVFAEVVKTLSVNAAAVSARRDSMLWATDVADYLVSKGLPFRQAHKVVGSLVRHCLERGLTLDKVPQSVLKEFSPAFASDVAAVFSWDAAIEHRGIAGGTGSASVQAQLQKARALVG